MEAIMALGPKALSLYAALALYIACGIYALVLIAPRLGSGDNARANLLKKKPSQYTSDDILALSAMADEYELAQEPYTASYIADLALDIANYYELSEEDKESLRIAALLHDVGQIEEYDFIQEERALRHGERLELENHTIWGYQRIKEMGPEYEKAALWVRWSHERWDGTGYPDGLQGEHIPVPARILSIVDAYCAMMQDRPYRGALSQEAAVAELKRFAGIKYDPQMVQMFGAGEGAESTALEVV